MRKYRSLIAVAAAVVLALPVFAGEYGEKCTADTQACLNMMAKHMKSSPWIGVEIDHTAGLVKAVLPDSPAQAAGFKVGDKVIALNGIDFADRDALGAEWQSLKPGTQAVVKVERNGAVRKLNVTLAAMPDDVIAQKVGSHMLEHAVVDVAQN